MNVSKLKFAVIGLLIAGSQVACGPYLPYVEEEWIVEEPVTVAPHGYFSYEQITFKISWNQDDYSEDLIATLVTPHSELVEDGGPELDGCYFLGTYNETQYQKVSIIECDDPGFGTYELQIENISNLTHQARIEVTHGVRDDYGVDEYLYHQYTTVYDGSTNTIPFTF